MREIKFLGSYKRGNDSVNYKYSLFECPACSRQVERKRKDGIKATFCTRKCSSLNRGKRGPYKEFVMISGYRYLQAPNHPNATKKGYVAEHRLVAEKKIGRHLNNDEDVHHINEIKTDNRPENLQILTKSEHMKIHKLNAKREDNGKFAA